MPCVRKPAGLTVQVAVIIENNPVDAVIVVGHWQPRDDGRSDLVQALPVCASLKDVYLPIRPPVFAGDPALALPLEYGRGHVHSWSGICVVERDSHPMRGAAPTRAICMARRRPPVPR